MKPTIRLLPQETPEALCSRIPIRNAILWQPDNGLIQPREPVVSIFVTQKAYVRFCAHASSDLENEVGGWLLGKKRFDKESGEQFIVIDTILPAQHTQHGSAYLTFTQDTQVALHNHLQANYPEKDLVGWFHTHPRMGIFLSAYDTWLHQNFFPEIWQVALVVEPFSRTGGFFIRQSDGQLDPRSYYGFYELIGRKKRSVVHWRNMISDDDWKNEGVINEKMDPFL
jgi:proteasome lid subunit RPN8/RPN11